MSASGFTSIFSSTISPSLVSTSKPADFLSTFEPSVNFFAFDNTSVFFFFGFFDLKIFDTESAQPALDCSTFSISLCSFSDSSLSASSSLSKESSFVGSLCSENEQH